MFKWTQKKKLAGLDIGSSSVKSVELSSNARKATLVYLATETLPSHAIEDGQILESATVSNAIVTVFSNQRSKAQEMAVAVNGWASILKIIMLPPMSDAELAESIDWHAEEHIPFDLADVFLDYQPLESLPNDELRVLVATCNGDKVASLKLPIHAAGKQTSIVDFDLLALGNCYVYNYEPDRDCLIALVDIGASSLNLNIMRGHRSEFMRTAHIGGNAFTELLQKELGLSREQAEAAKRSGTREIEIKGAQIGGVAEELSKMLSFKALTDTFSEQVANEIQKSFDFYRTISENEARVERLILSGGSSRIEGLIDFLSRKFEIPVERIDPFRRIECDESVFSREQLNEVAPEMAVAVGFLWEVPYRL